SMVPPASDFYTLSLHDALPILGERTCPAPARSDAPPWARAVAWAQAAAHAELAAPFRRRCFWAARTWEGAQQGRTPNPPPPEVRSEEHTSELQSRENIVCRLLL